MVTSPESLLSLPASLFQWVLAALTTVSTGFVGLLWWVFRRHLKEDEDRELATITRLETREHEVNRRFELQEAIIDRRHAENQQSREMLRSEMATGNQSLMTQMGANRREIVDVLLQLSAQMRGGGHGEH